MLCQLAENDVSLIDRCFTFQDSCDLLSEDDICNPRSASPKEGDTTTTDASDDTNDDKTDTNDSDVVMTNGKESANGTG